MLKIKCDVCKQEVDEKNIVLPKSFEDIKVKWWDGHGVFPSKLLVEEMWCEDCIREAIWFYGNEGMY